jgi:CheY-like chemotaxis protein
MTRPPSVLVVEDDADVRETVAEALEDQGYRVSSAVNGLHALRLLREQSLRPDVILLDMMMPELDGWGFRAEQQKEPALAAIPVVVFTAYGVPNDTAQQLGAAGFLRKPVHLDELLSTLRRVRQGAESTDPKEL